MCDLTDGNSTLYHLNDSFFNELAIGSLLKHDDNLSVSFRCVKLAQGNPINDNLDDSLKKVINIPPKTSARSRLTCVCS